MLFFLTGKSDMMSSTLVIFVSVTTVAILSGETFAALPTQCNSGFLEELPPRIRKVCVALARIWREREMNEFVEDGGNRLLIKRAIYFRHYIKQIILPIFLKDNVKLCLIYASA